MTTKTDTLNTALEDRLLEGLNQRQLECVIHDKGPLLIVAGAGTGKTAVITRRIAYLITSKKALPEEILALTFTDKAASEMEGRVDILVPYGYTDVRLSTFHAFGDRVLREQALELGLSTEFQVLSRPQQLVFLKEHLFELPLNKYRPLGDPSRYIEALLTLFSRAKDEDTSPEEYLEYAHSITEEADKHTELALTFKKYQELMTKENKIDFGDQVVLTLRLFREHPSVLRRYQERFKYILVDEFQDTNYAQYQLVKLLSGSRANITVVADDDQSIYKWRGAAISNIINFTKDYPDAKCEVLCQNYRSTQVILDSSYKLIRHNDPDRLEVRQGIDKRLTSVTDEEGMPPRWLSFKTLSEESDYAAKTIRSGVDKGEYQYQDFAILVRSNKEAEAFLRALNMVSIPWRFTGNAGLYSRQEIRTLLAFLRSVADPNDSLSIYQLASSQIFNIPMSEIINQSNLARIKNRSLFEILKEQQAQGVFSGLINDINEFQELSRRLTPGQLLYKFLKDTGYLNRLLGEENIASIEKVQNIAAFFEIIRGLEGSLHLDQLQGLVSHLDSLIESGADPPTSQMEEELPAVDVLTVHKAKGLEWPVVFLVGLVQGRFPVQARPDPLEFPHALIKDILPVGDFHLQEERRLFYVGMTRAKKELYLTSSLDYGGKRTRKVSRFVCEALDITLSAQSYAPSSAMQIIERSSPVQAGVDLRLGALSDEDILALTSHKIDDYLTCPLKYKFVNILRLPVLAHHAVVYGRAIHNAIEAYLLKRLEGAAITGEQMFKAFEAAWINEGFVSRAHEEFRFKRGRQLLSEFHRRERCSNRVPAYIEKEFNFIFENNKISGRWDRIDLLKDKTIILDYKTSNVTRQETADKETKESIQMNIYAWAWLELEGKLPDRVELHFLESDLIGAKSPDKEDIGEIKKKVRMVSQGIRMRNFNAKPDYHSCRWCAYRRICDYAER